MNILVFHFELGFILLRNNTRWFIKIKGSILLHVKSHVYPSILLRKIIMYLLQDSFCVPCSILASGTIQ